MKSRPILFSAPMVRALLEGRKTQTRRLVKDRIFFQNCVPHVPVGVHGSQPWKCPYGAPGDLLWVRETWALPIGGRWEPSSMQYRVDHNEAAVKYACRKGGSGWKPSIHMPRKGSRLTLEITNVRVERLKDISEDDAKDEGIEISQDGVLKVIAWRNYLSNGSAFVDPRESYKSLWELINGDGSWDANPWVVALTFKVHKANVDAVLEQCKEVAA